MKKDHSYDESRAAYRMAVMQEQKEPSDKDRLNEALVDLLVALDVVEDALWASCNYCRKFSCPVCATTGEHSRRCKAAALLRKYGRQVKIAGDK